MIVTIVGWYGTETSGDRAILDGILSVLHEIDQTAQVKLGSLFPFYSERTLLEEKEVFKESAPGVEIELFDIKEKKSLSENVKKSDLLILGGGPLMDLEELYLIEHAFFIAKRQKIPAIVMGCGIGPLNEEKYIHLVERILEKSTKISLRDRISGNNMEKLWAGKFTYDCFGDPAVISVENYLKKRMAAEKEDYLAVNFRDFPGVQYGSNTSVDMVAIADMLNTLSEKCREIFLVPMHTFHVGNDDRKYLTQLKMQCNNSKIKVLHNPLNLHELYKIYGNATGCIGMRYHSIVMQTILNGNNLVFDYTDPNSGKISGFLNMENGNAFYSDRKICLKTDVNKDLKEMGMKLFAGEKFSYQLSDMKREYVRFLEDI